MVKSIVSNRKIEGRCNHLGHPSWVRNCLYCPAALRGSSAVVKSFFFLPLEVGACFCSSLFVSICILLPTEIARLVKYVLENQSQD